MIAPKYVRFLLMLVGLLTAALVAAPPAWSAARERVSLDAGWRFTVGDAPDAGLMFEYAEADRLDKVEAGVPEAEAALEARRFDAVAANLGGNLSFVQPDFDDHEWQSVQAPHDWAVTLSFDPRGDPARGYRIMDTASGKGVGWYRLVFDLPAGDAGRALSLEFDGVFRNCMVWLNGRCLGRHVGGYDSFRFDIDAAARPGQPNLLVVRVDATRNEGWWYEGAGIHRHVWLVKTDRVHFAPHGIFAQPRVLEGKASVKVTTWLRNLTEGTVRVRLTTSIADDGGAVMGTSTARRIDVPAGGIRRVIRTIEVRSPRLWSTEDPYRYRVLSSIDDLSGTLDLVETPFGIRSVEFDAAQGLLLNGVRVQVKGAILHPDHAGVGVAVPDRLLQGRLERLQEMGVNAIRPAYGPAAPALLELCDRMGIMVLEEHRRPGAGAADLATLERMVLRDRNHPCVIAWCLGSDEFAVQGSDEFARKVIAPMRDLVRRVDPSRPVTMAMNWDWGRGVSAVVDVQGFSYRGNGIRGQRLALEKLAGGFPDMDAFHAAYPKKPAIITTEGGAVATRGVYASDGTRGWYSAYDTNIPPWGDFVDLVHGNWGSTAEGWWRYTLERPWIAGGFLDSAFDHRGNPAPLTWPIVSTQTGVMDLCGFPKDTYYFYKAWWGKKPVIHLLPHWNWRGHEGKEIDVWSFANTEEVELLLNGRSLGRKPMPRDSHLAWSVPYQPGVIEARGFTAGRLIGSARYETTDVAFRLVLTTDRTELAADGRDIAIITVAAVDSKGRVVPNAMNGVDLEMTSGGRILGTGNGNPASHESEQGLRRTLFNGLAQVIVQSMDVPAPITLTATSPGLVPATIVIEAVKPAASP